MSPPPGHSSVSLKVVLLGDDSDVRGFRLAGVESRRVEDGRDLSRALVALAGEKDVGLVLVSGSLAADAIPAVRAASARGVPILLSLPEDGKA